MSLLKQVIAVRTDLRMGRGKIAAQVAHASVTAAEIARVSYTEWWNEWWNTQEKVVVKVGRYADLEQIRQEAARSNLPHRMIHDAGHTQVAPGTATCVAVGPAPEHMVDRITGTLSLL